MIHILQFVAILLTALYLVPGGAHLLELAGKISMDQNQYLTVQQIYRGWALFGIVLFIAIFVNSLAAFMMRTQPWPRNCAIAAAALLLLGLAVFFIWTLPVNQATANWTIASPDWQAQRSQWEISHAANAGITFLALCSIIAAGLLWSDKRD